MLQQGYSSVNCQLISSYFDKEHFHGAKAVINWNAQWEENAFEWLQRVYMASVICFEGEDTFMTSQNFLALYFFYPTLNVNKTKIILFTIHVTIICVVMWKVFFIVTNHLLFEIHIYLGPN